MNGWSNHATWQLWTDIQNNERSYKLWQKMAKNSESVADLRNELRMFFNGSNTLANMYEIAKHLWEDTHHVSTAQ